MLDRAGGIQWPYPAEEDTSAATEADATTGPDTTALPVDNQRRLFADGRFFTPDAKARLISEASRPVPEPTTSDFPLTLLTGRGSSAQWHTLSRTGKSAVLNRLAPRKDIVEINPADARARDISTNDRVAVVSRRATVVLQAFVTHTVRAGEVFVPMHDARVNKLTFAAFDPHSRQPAYKAAAVQVSRAPGDV